MPEPCQRKLEEKIQVKIPKEKFSNNSINKNFTHKVFEEKNSHSTFELLSSTIPF